MNSCRNRYVMEHGNIPKVICNDIGAQTECVYLVVRPIAETVPLSYNQ